MSCVALQGSEVSPADGGTAQALLFAHCWLMHPIGSLDQWGIVNKQSLFWPYIGSGFGCMLMWWSSMGSSSSIFTFAAATVVLQYAGRWGLFLRLVALYGAPVSADTFEVRKQPAELASFVLAFAVSLVSATVMVPFTLAVLTCVLLLFSG